MMSEPKDFNELVTYVTWEIIEGIAKGEQLRSVVYRMLSYVRQWEPAK